MYSGYMNPAKKTSVLRFTPPGFKYALDIPFPGRVLPVCARCKKNYKTREHCRTKEQHHTLPWTDTYICLTFDSSCFGPDGGLRLEEGPFTAHGVQSQPYIYPEEIDLDPKTPSCAQCKDKNYTRTYCRTNKKHRTLPWSTVYAVLSGPPQGGGGGVQDYRNGEGVMSGGAGGEESMIPPSSSADEDSLPKKRLKTNQGNAIKAEMDSKDESSSNVADVDKKDGDDKILGGDDEDKSKDKKEQTETENVNEEGEDKAKEVKEPKEEDKDSSDAKEKKVEDKEFEDIFNNPHPSKTFLATVSLTKNEVRWVDMDQAQAALMHHRNSKSQAVDFELQDGVPHMHPSQMPYQMMHPSAMHPMAFHPSLGPFQGIPSHYFGYGQGQHGIKMEGPGGGMDMNRSGGGGNQMDSLQQQQGWMNQNDPSGGMPYPNHEMMYQAQMMDPRAAAMAGYGYQSWNQQGGGGQARGGGGGGGGYPMDMGGMGGAPPSAGQMQYDGHMMQQMGWGNPPPQQQGGQGGDMSGMPPQSMSPHGGGMHGHPPMHGMPLMQGMVGNHHKDIHAPQQQPYSPQRMHDIQTHGEGNGSAMRQNMGNGHADIRDEGKDSEENVSI